MPIWRESVGGLQPFLQLRPTSPAHDVAYRDGDSLLLPDQHDHQPVGWLVTPPTSPEAANQLIRDSLTMEKPIRNVKSIMGSS